MFFRQILHPERACLSYLIGCPTLGRCAAIDPQGSADTIVQTVAANGMRITHIFETHIHADHRSAARELQALTGAPIYLGPGTRVDYAVETLVDEQVLKVGKRRIRVLHTPGHSAEHVCLLGDDWYLLTGDALFVGDVGRVDLGDEAATPRDFERCAGQLYQSLQRLLALPDWIEIYPGHYAGSACGRDLDGKPVSTIGRERRMNRALGLSQPEFIQFQLENRPELPEDFRSIRQMNMSVNVSP
ncbi:MAG: MBL fold metallo-hydrolase [Bellilinea sp.]